MRGVYYSACSLCYKTIGVTKNICLLLRDSLLFRRLLLPESTVVDKVEPVVEKVEEVVEEVKLIKLKLLKKLRR